MRADRNLAVSSVTGALHTAWCLKRVFPLITCFGGFAEVTAHYAVRSEGRR